MARDLFINVTDRRLTVSETNSAPTTANFTKGDDGVFRLYFLEPTGVINRPFEVIDLTGTDVKLGIGLRTAAPRSGTYTLAFSAETTSDIAAAASAADLQTALNGLTAISSAGGVSVTGTLEDHFTIRFNTAGTQSAITANVSQLIPDTIAIIDERIEGTATEREVQELQLRLLPAVFQDTWTDINTAITASIATTVTGTDLLNEVQRLSFTQPPFLGTYQLSFPATALTVATPVTAGVFITSVTHGLAFNQPVSITGFDTTITGYDRGQNYFVAGIPLPDSFTLSLTPGGTALTGEATTTTTQGTVNTIARQTQPIDAKASAADVQAALQTLDSIGAGGVIVTGIPGKFFDITFSGQKGYADQPELIVQNGTTARPGKSATIDFQGFGVRDFLGNVGSVTLELEVELTEGASIQTALLAPCTVSEELIV